MTEWKWSSNARETSLTGAVNSSDTTFQVDSPVGWPSTTPFIALVELGTSNEEIVLVTGVAGNAWTVTRGYDSSTAVAHDVGAKLVHGPSGLVFTEIDTHKAATTNIHGLGVGAALVGTTTSQTLTNKTLTSPTIDTPTASGGTYSGGTFTSGTFNSPTLVTPTIADFTSAQHDHADAAGGGTVSGGGGAATYLGASYASASQIPALSTWVTVNGLSLTYTAPADWPDDATKLVYAVTVTWEGSELSSNSGAMRLRDGSTTINPPGEWPLGQHFGSNGHFSGMWPVDLPSAGSHTVTLQIFNGMDNVDLQQRSLLAFLV